MELVVAAEETDVTGGDIDRHVDLTRLERHGAGVRIVDGGYFHLIVGHRAVPIVRVLFEDALVAGKALHHVRAGTDGAFLREVSAILLRFHVDDEEQGIGELPWHVRHRLRRVDDELLPFGLDAGVLKEGLGAVLLREGALDGRLDRFRRHRIAVREFRFVLDLKRPRQMIVADLPALRQPRLGTHLLVEFRQRLADAVAHDHPREIVLRRLQGVGEVRDADLQRIGSAAPRGGAAATAAHQERRCHAHGQPRRDEFFEFGIEYHTYPSFFCNEI